MKKNNTTVVTTKSGTLVYVVGKYSDKPLRDKVGDQFVNYFNKNFTVKEQKQIGNIFYDLYNKDHFTMQHPNTINKEWLACTGTFTGKDAVKFNPLHKKMVDMYFRPHVRNDESAVTHELIHAKKFMTGIKNHNERKIDFEMVGRISEKGIDNIEHGYYFHPEGNPYLAKRKGLTLKKKGEIGKKGVYADRILLTGSKKKSLIGDPIVKEVDKKFKKSFFFKRTF